MSTPNLGANGEIHTQCIIETRIAIANTSAFQDLRRRLCAGLRMLRHSLSSACDGRVIGPPTSASAHSAQEKQVPEFVDFPCVLLYFSVRHVFYVPQSSENWLELRYEDFSWCCIQISSGFLEVCSFAGALLSRARSFDSKRVAAPLQAGSVVSCCGPASLTAQKWCRALLPTLAERARG